MAHYILTGKKPVDMEHFAYDRFAQGREIRPRYSDSPYPSINNRRNTLPTIFLGSSERNSICLGTW